MRPIGKPVMSKEEAQRTVDGFRKAKNKVVGGVKSYGKNVMGGAKIVGGAIKKGLNSMKRGRSTSSGYMPR